MFFLFLTISLIIMLTGIGILSQGSSMLGWVLIGTGALSLLALIAYYNSKNKRYRIDDCLDPVTCSSCTPDWDLPRPRVKGLDCDCDCMPDCNCN